MKKLTKLLTLLLMLLLSVQSNGQLAPGNNGNGNLQGTPNDATLYDLVDEASAGDTAEVFHRWAEPQIYKPEHFPSKEEIQVFFENIFEDWNITFDDAVCPDPGIRAFKLEYMEEDTVYVQFDNLPGEDSDNPLPVMLYVGLMNYNHDNPGSSYQFFTKQYFTNFKFPVTGIQCHIIVIGTVCKENGPTAGGDDARSISRLKILIIDKDIL